MHALQVVCSLELAALGWARRWSLCVHLLDRFPRSLLDTACYNAAASGCSTASFWLTAFQLVQSFCSHGLLPNTVSMNSLLPSFKDNGLWMPALRILSLISECRSSPDKESAAGAIDACRHGQAWQLAEQLLEESGSQLLETGKVHLEGAMHAHQRQWPRTVPRVHACPELPQALK